MRAPAIALNTAGMMSIERVHGILAGVPGMPIGTGCMARMVSRFGEMTGDTAQEIKQALLGKPVVNCDETGTRVNGGTCWLHPVCDAQYTCLSLQARRGSVGMANAGFLPFYEGTIIHDCRAPYWSFSKLRHGLCGAHLLRELQGIIDSDPEATWAKSVQALLREMNQCRSQAVEKGQPAIHESQVANFGRRYSIILGKARRKNPAAEYGQTQKRQSPGANRQTDGT